MTKRVVFLQRVLPHYRVPFFRLLAKGLIDSGIDFRLLYGQHQDGQVPRTIDITDSWSTKIRNRYFSTVGGGLVWQPCISKIRGSDLVIAESANSLLVNYILAFRRKASNPRLAFFCHGRNFQGHPQSRVRERMRGLLLRRADWLFAYTQRSADVLLQIGCDSSRITNVNNTVDTSELLKSMRDPLVKEKTKRIQADLGLVGAKVGVYCGGMYAHKRLQFLLDSAILIREEIPNFHLVLLGDGPDAHLVKLAASEYDWIHYVGSMYGVERVPYLALGSVMLMPGLVGLVIVDSFAIGVPLVTTDIKIHSPEIDYLAHNVNGVMTANDEESFAAGVIEVLQQSDLRHILKRGCNDSAKAYTLERMVQNFSDGIMSSLS